MSCVFNLKILSRNYVTDGQKNIRLYGGWQSILCLILLMYSQVGLIYSKAILTPVSVRSLELICRLEEEIFDQTLMLIFF